MNALSRSRLMDQTLQELRRLKEQGPTSSYRAALQVAAPGLLEELLEHQDKMETVPHELVCQAVADWLWLRLLGWCQSHGVSEAQREGLFKLIESVRAGLPLPLAVEPLPTTQPQVHQTAQVLDDKPTLPGTEICIEILHRDVCAGSNLPSQYFPDAGSDGALFQVTPKTFPFPDYERICSALTRWDSDTMLMDYEQTTGKGYFKLVDSPAPRSGQVINLPGLVEDF